jgi:uncharacterized protein YndB with AHSA1/START domain
VDFREGGTSILCMRSPDGVDTYNAWTYQRIIPRERIEFTQILCDADGRRPDPAAVVLGAVFGADVRGTLTLAQVGRRIRITLVEDGYQDGPPYRYAVTAMKQMLDKLAIALSIQDRAANGMAPEVGPYR